MKKRSARVKERKGRLLVLQTSFSATSLPLMSFEFFSASNIIWVSNMTTATAERPCCDLYLSSFEQTLLWALNNSLAEKESGLNCQFCFVSHLFLTSRILLCQVVLCRKNQVWCVLSFSLWEVKKLSLCADTAPASLLRHSYEETRPWHAVHNLGHQTQADP